MKERLYAFMRILGGRFEMKGEKKLSQALTTFSKTERRIFSALVIVFIGSAILILARVNSAFLVEVPAHGGSLSEGIIGTPKFINPLLAASDADRDLTALVYSGLMRRDGSGDLTPDLAESYTISPDGLVYTFTLKEGLTFHDKEPLTADDVAFTIARSQESVIRSDIRGRWDGVTVEAPDARTVRFTLKKPYVSFLDNTTIGILPKHIWEKITSDAFLASDRNTDPIGSGPYKVDSISRSSDGKSISSYSLASFNRFALKEPFIANITFFFYQDEDAALKALRARKIESMASVSPASAAALTTEGQTILSSPEQRLYGVFFNQTQAPIFADKGVRSALLTTVDRARITNEVFHSYATPLSRPIPPGILGYTPESIPPSLTAEDIATARASLEADGWKFDENKNVYTKKQKKGVLELHFTIATRNIPELKATAEILKETWGRIGASVDISYFDEGDLRETIIRPRKYEALLFGGVFPSESALYSFWHSSQRNDPGYNITMYANSVTDKILENVYSTTGEDDRAKEYAQFEKEIAKDIPAIFLYAPNLLYVVPNDLKGIASAVVTDPSDRLSSVRNWYRETERVWKIFE